MGSNSHGDRTPVGEALKTFIYEDEGKLSAVTISKLDESAKNMDVCSIEADVDYDDDGTITDVYGTTAVALGSSLTDSPAFAGAQKLATIQCFETEKILSTREDKSMAGEQINLTFQDVVMAVKRMNIFPSQLYSFEDVKEDRRFSKDFGDMEKRAVDAEKERDDFKTKYDELEKSSSENNKKALKADSNDRMQKLIPEGTTDRQKAYIDQLWKSGKVEDFSDDGIKKFIDESIADFAVKAKLFGVEVTEKPAGHKPGGGESSDTVEAVMKELNEMS